MSETSLPRLDALGVRGPYRTRAAEPIADVRGRAVAELSLVPPLFVQRSMKALGTATTPPVDERIAVLHRLGAALATDTVDGVSAEEHHRRVAAVSGLPITFVRRATRQVSEYAATVDEAARMARPLGAAADWHDPTTRAGSAVWVRRGDVLAVHAPANTPGVHAAWLDALALGYRVALRPSRRDPFTPHRMVAALREAGYGSDQVVLLPTDHATADRIIADADFAMAFGGDDVVRKYGSRGPTVLTQGPGRSKILLTEGTDPARYLDMIVESISDQGGTGCINATAVFVEGDPTPVAEAIAERLSGLTAATPEDDAAALPVRPLDEARAIDEHLRQRRESATPLLGADGILADLGDGSAALRPAVFQLDDAAAPQARIELGFPCVWVAPWRRSDGIAPLRDTLVLTAVTQDSDLVDQLVAEPSIRNLHVGAHATTWRRPGLPHDGYLGEFLMRAKTVIRESPEPS